MLYLRTFMEFISQHTFLIYSAIFLIALMESLAIIGLIVPGTVIMFIVGAIAATGNLEIITVLMIAIVGAIAGDGISYWLGYHYRDRLKSVWPFSRYPHLIKSGEEFINKHGGKSILFGRFVGPVRPIVPVVAGMLGMKPIHFAFVNVLSAIGWGIVYIFPGYLFGASLEMAGAVSSRLVVLILIIIFTAWIFIWLSKKLFLFISEVGPRWASQFENWILSDQPKYGFTLYTKEFLLIFYHPRKRERFLFLFLIFILLFASWGFLFLLNEVLAGNSGILNLSVYQFLQSLRTPWADDILITITELGDSFVNVCIAAAVLLVLLGKRCYQTALYWVITILGGFLVSHFMKWLIQLPRPIDIYSGITAFGFPSGHTSMSVILYGFLAILVTRNLKGKSRWISFLAIFLISFIIAFSRLYLGAHWLTDVIGGFLLGTAWMSLLGVIYLRQSKEIVPRFLLLLISFLTLLIIGGYHVLRYHERDLTFYRPRYFVEIMSQQTWLKNDWQKLPAWRMDLEGELMQPITIQFNGNTATFDKYLLSKGWKHSTSLTLKSFLSMLSSHTPIEQLPVFPRLHNGQVEIITLVYKNNNTRWVLRLWPTDIKIDNNPLAIGTIEMQRSQFWAHLINFPRNIPNYNLAVQYLEHTLTAALMVKVVQRTKMPLSPEGKKIQWNGKVLLIWTTQ